MKNILLIAKREYFSQVRKKSFIILSILAPLLLIISGLVVGYIIKDSKIRYRIAVSDASGIFSKMENTDNLIFQYLPENEISASKEILSNTSNIDGILIIPECDDNFIYLENYIKLFTNKNISLSIQKEISDVMSDKIIKLKAKKAGLNENQISEINQKIALKIENIKENTDNSLTASVKSSISGTLMYATLMFIIIYGVRVMRSVLEEKNSRIVEIIISSVRPFDLMLGKILGVTMVALTQFITWIVMGIGLALFFTNKYSYTNLNSHTRITELGNNLEVFSHISQISEVLFSINYVLIICVFIFYFILGYIFYSSIYAAIGSAVDNEIETQQFTVFAVIPLMISLYGGVSIMNNPESGLAFWLSLIPFTSPVSMIARIPFGVPAWQLIISMLILLTSVFIMVILAGKIYRIGILMHGNRVTLKEVWKWVKQTD